MRPSLPYSSFQQKFLLPVTRPGDGFFPPARGKRPFLYLKGHSLAHGLQDGEHLFTLVRRKKQLEQGLLRVEHCEHGEVVFAFQKITKKTRITGSNTDQKHF